MHVIANGIDVRPDPAALIVGPTGVGLEADTLYVADSANSRILAFDDASGGPMGPGPDPGPLDNNAGGGGNLFGLALTPDNQGIYFVDDFGADNDLFVAH
jgi:hypothetical protein